MCIDSCINVGAKKSVLLHLLPSARPPSAIAVFLASIAILSLAMCTSASEGVVYVCLVCVYIWAGEEVGYRGPIVCAFLASGVFARCAALCEASQCRGRVAV